MKDTNIAQKLEKVSHGLAGRIGVAAQEIGSGVSVTINGDEAFVMASTYKVAIATTLLDRVDKGQLIVTPPDGRRFAIAVFTKSSTTSEADRDRAIAEISRSLYDFYYFAAQDK